MVKVLNVARVVVATVCMAFIAWAVYLRNEAMAPLIPWMSDRPGLYTVVTIVACFAVGILLAPLRAPGGREVTGTPQPGAGRSSSILAMIAAALAVATSLYLSHAAIFGDEKVIWIDRYAGVLLPLILAVATAAWLYDTLYSHILTGTATGKSPMKQRTLLVLKRLAVAGLVAAVMLQPFVPILHLTSSSAYDDPSSRIMLTAIAALGASLVLISRAPAFRPGQDGSVV